MLRDTSTLSPLARRSGKSNLQPSGYLPTRSTSMNYCRPANTLFIYTPASQSLIGRSSNSLPTLVVFLVPMRLLYSRLWGPTPLPRSRPSPSPQWWRWWSPCSCTNPAGLPHQPVSAPFPTDKHSYHFSPHPSCLWALGRAVTRRPQSLVDFYSFHSAGEAVLAVHRFTMCFNAQFVV